MASGGYSLVGVRRLLMAETSRRAAPALGARTSVAAAPGLRAQAQYLGAWT